jgi:hypothetical protein
MTICRRFGKGVYFADMSSKSANYCFATKGKLSEGVMLLSEVALGDMHELLHANDKLPKVPAPSWLSSSLALSRASSLPLNRLSSSTSATSHGSAPVDACVSSMLETQPHFLMPGRSLQGKPADKLSVKGKGKTFPDPAGAETLENGCVVPCGMSSDNSLTVKSSLLYNEVCYIAAFRMPTRPVPAPSRWSGATESRARHRHCRAPSPASLRLCGCARLLVSRLT